MAEKVQSTEETPKAEGAPTPPPKRGLGHRGADPRDTAAELAARAHAISLEAGSKMAGAMRDVIHAAAGISGFVADSARDLVNFMVRRGQMSADEAEKLIREAEEAHSRRVADGWEPSGLPEMPEPPAPAPVVTIAAPVVAPPPVVAAPEPAAPAPRVKPAAKPVAKAPAKEAHHPAKEAHHPAKEAHPAKTTKHAKPAAKAPAKATKTPAKATKPAAKAPAKSGAAVKTASKAAAKASPKAPAKGAAKKAAKKR
jgi:hypothetical protein